MGCNMSSSPEAQAQLERNKQITASLQAAKREMDKETKLLLLGTGESGKSTISKQMRILHMDGFTDDDRVSFRRVIRGNVIENMLSLVYGADKLGIQLHEAEAAAEIRRHDDFDVDDDFEGLVPVIPVCWGDPGVQEAYRQSSKFQLMDNCAYFMSRFSSISESSYRPSDQDILYARSKTTGVMETCFTVGRLSFRIVDVGGQRSERKKWIHCFEDVTAIIVCVSLSEYDLKLDEDETTGRMVESVRLFRQIVNSSWFASADVILFLNKKDLFAEKIERVPLTVAFPKYSGPNEFGPASKYIQEQFLAQCDDPKKVIYPHVTCATDSSNIETVFLAVREMLMSRVLGDTGLGEI